MFRDFFYLPKSDRRIILSAIVVIGVAVTVIHFAGGRDQTANKPQEANETYRANRPNEGYRTNEGYRSNEPSKPNTPTPAERFPFDPNTADSTALLRLGLAKWQVNNIYKYRQAGGIYRSKEDFAQLYGLTVKQYRELEPYISISADYQPASTLFTNRKSENSSGVEHRDSTLQPRYPIKLTEGETIDLSTADTTLLQRVPGIGPYYARRIADYRQRLGGFVSLAQLDEIDGFPHEALPYLTLEAGAETVVKLHVNNLSVDQLKRHPYLTFYQARAIVDYRRQNGPITDIDELRLLPDFGDEAIEKLRPYVTY